MDKPVKKYKCVSDVECGDTSIKNNIFFFDNEVLGYKSEILEEGRSIGIYWSIKNIENSKDFVPVSQDGETREEMIAYNHDGIEYLYYNSISKRWGMAYRLQELLQSIPTHFFKRKPEPKTKKVLLDFEDLVQRDKEGKSLFISFNGGIKGATSLEYCESAGGLSYIASDVSNKNIVFYENISEKEAFDKKITFLNGDPLYKEVECGS